MLRSYEVLGGESEEWSWSSQGERVSKTSAKKGPNANGSSVGGRLGGGSWS